MIIPVWVDEKKDKVLIEWLSEKTNRSACIREILYNYIKGVKIEITENTKLDNNFIDSLDNF